MIQTAENIKSELGNYANKEKAEFFPRFFKTGKGQYGEGDKFLGLTVPQQRAVSIRFKDLPIEELSKLIKSEYHEHRLTALFILVNRFRKSKSEDEKKKLINFYLKHTKYINNWDLVDSSANILGQYLHDKDRKVLYKLAKSENLWEQRIAIIATSYFITRNDFIDTLKISEILLHHEHDLIHKAVGWMLREVGKRNINVEIEFLDTHYKTMPRTMLRYAIERFPEKLRLNYLKK